MTRPRRWEDEVLEMFRVDAEAEGDHIVIGGWEVPVPESGSTMDARWFSVTLNRKNAPWAYLKGEPFKNIASLELSAVLVPGSSHSVWRPAIAADLLEEIVSHRSH